MEENKSSPRIGLGEDKKYAVVSPLSVTMMAEAQGHANMTVEISSLLAEDVTYRLRELIQNACQYMKHSRRKRLTVEDINRSLKSADVQPVFGHGAPEGQPWRQTKEGELYLTEDLDMALANIACNSQVPHSIGSTTVRVNWLVIEGNQKGASLSQSSQGKINGKPGRISDDLLQYHNNITRAILGTDQELMKLALTDLRTNPNLSPLLPYLVEFVSNWIKNMNHDQSRLTKLLYTINALVNNNSLFLEPRPYLSLLTESVLHCMTESLDNSLGEHWCMRDYAARLLAIICRQWDSPVNRLYDQVLKQLSQILHDKTLPFSAHYGVITTLNYFGIQALKDVLVPYFHTYWQHLTATLDDVTLISEKLDAHKVYGALMCAAEVIIKYHKHDSFIKANMASSESKPLPILQPPITTPAANSDFSVSTPDVFSTVTLSLPEAPLKEIDVNNCYSEFVEYFGDSLVARLSITSQPLFKKSNRKEADACVNNNVISLADADSQRSGEEMLQEFLTKTVTEPVAKRLESVDMDIDRRSDSRRSFDVLSSEFSYNGSSRSERSQSDDCFHGEDDLTVKTTLNDPTKGIKLFITKRPRKQSSQERIELSKRLKTQSKSIVKLSDTFEMVPLQMPTYEVKFGFDTRNWRSESPFSQPLRKCKASLTVPVSSVVKKHIKSRYMELCQAVNPIGKIKKVSSGNNSVTLQKTNSCSDSKKTLLDAFGSTVGSFM